VLGALALFLIFALANALAFTPTARRYDASVKRNTALGLSADRVSCRDPAAAGVRAAHRSRAAAGEAQERANSGALTASLLEDLNQIASQHGLSVLATEPGPVSQDPQSARVRAHLKMRGSYAAFVSWLADVAKDGSLAALDRFSLQPGEGGSMLIDVSVSRYVLKQGVGTP